MKLIQITDCHIKKDNDALIYDVNPRNKLIKIVEDIKLKNNDANVILLTGDISDDGSVESYEFVSDLLSSLSKEIYFINGNHDCKKNMWSVFSKNNYFTPLREMFYDNWFFIGIDSTIKGKDYGFVPEIELHKLKISLTKAQKDNKNIVVVTHHHPILVNTPLIDDCPLNNGLDVIKILKEFDHVKLVITGHVHNDYSINIENTKLKLETGPATCVQFVIGGANEVSDIDRIKHGYKTYIMDENSFHTECFWIGN